MLGAAIETSERAEGQVYDELRRATAVNAWHEQQGSQRKVKMGQQLFRIKEERCYVGWDYQSLKSYTDVELKLKPSETDQYIRIRGLSLEQLEGTDYSLGQLDELRKHDPRLHAGLVQAMQEDPKVKPKDLKRGGAAGQRVLEKAPEGDEAAYEEARRRAYEATLGRDADERPLSEAAQGLKRALGHTAKVRRQLQKQLMREKKEEQAKVDEAWLQELDDQLRDLLLQRRELFGELPASLRECFGAAAAAATATEAHVETQAEAKAAEAKAEAKTAETRAEAKTAATPPEEQAGADETLSTEDEPSVDEDEDDSEEDEDEEDEAPRDSAEDADDDEDEEDDGSAWMRRTVQGVLAVLDEAEKQRLSDLLYAGLRGADVAPLLTFLEEEVTEQVRGRAQQDLDLWIMAAEQKDLWARWHYLFNFFVEAKLPDMRMRLFCLRGLQLPPRYAEMVQDVYPGLWGPYEDMPAPTAPAGSNERDLRAIEARWHLQVAIRMAKEMEEDETSDLAKGTVMVKAFELERELRRLESWMKLKRLC